MFDKGEESLDFAVGAFSNGQSDGQILLVDVCDVLGVGRGSLSAVEGELDLVVDHAAGLLESCEAGESGERDGVDVGARAGDDKALDGRECEVAVGGCEEGQLAGDLAEYEAIEAVLFTLLSDH